MITTQAPRPLVWRVMNVIEAIGITLIAVCLLVWIGERLGMTSMTLPIDVFRIGGALTLAAFIVRQLGKPRGEAS